ncbi:MAG TPA: sulfotransferase [Candidatus Binataceae bacterium]|jgi:hypothetical protein|nr:sulfotransferase [Candidatus Binataceae bacterium]
MRTPNFFIIGGQRCGTTSLRRYLADHSRIFMCENPPEPRHFATDFVTSRSGRLSRAAYLKAFSGAGEQHLAVGEASPTYLPSAVAIANILQFNPEAKFIVLLRPQIDMARSLHARFFLDGFENVADFEEAWRLQSARRAGRLVPKACFEPKHLQYGDFCKLGEQLERLYQQVPEERVLVIFSREFRTQTQAVYERILSFLGVPSDGRQHFPIYEENRQRRSELLKRGLLTIDRLKIRLGMKSFGLGIANALDNLNERKEARNPLRPDFYAELVEYFRADVDKLSQLTHRDLSDWLRS